MDNILCGKLIWNVGKPMHVWLNWTIRDTRCYKTSLHTEGNSDIIHIPKHPHPHISLCLSLWGFCCLDTKKEILGCSYTHAKHIKTSAAGLNTDLNVGSVSALGFWQSQVFQVTRLRSKCSHESVLKRTYYAVPYFMSLNVKMTDVHNKCGHGLK